jgi:hypothetical protein
MSDIAAAPLILFMTRTNAELGAQSVSVDDDGTVVFGGVVKKVTESMILSYPRTMLGEWTPNRNAIRFTRDELAGRSIRRFDTGEELSLDAVVALAN